MIQVGKCKAAVQVGQCSAEVLFADVDFESLVSLYAAESRSSLLPPVSPKIALYRQLEAVGAAKCFGAFLNGYLRGFAFVICAPLPHDGRKYAVCESLFVHVEARRFGLGEMLMEAAEAYAMDQGCETILYSAPVGSRFAQLLFLHEDKYSHAGFTFMRRLA